MELSEMAIGIANLPNQIHRRSVIKGFDFNLLVVGDSGLGKSTFLNMLFQSNLYTEVPYDNFFKNDSNSVTFNSSLITLVENAVKLNMELIELNDIECCMSDPTKWNEVVSHITARFQKYLELEDSIKLSQVPNDPNRRDSRIHCCLYFIPPTGHRLRSVDINFLKTVGKWVNVVPLIAKADTLTPEELKAFKKRIREDIYSNNIQMYTFPDLNGLEVYQSMSSYDDATPVSPHYSALPFAVTASLTCISQDGVPASYIRKYPWGTVKIDDPSHSDFETFNNLFLKTHMFHMIFSTKHYIYEKYRRNKLLDKLGIKEDVTSDLDNELLSCSDMSLLAHEVMDMELSMKKENESLQQLEQELEAEYNKKVEEFRQIETKNLDEHETKYKALEKQLEEGTANMTQISRSNSKSSKGDKKKLAAKAKVKSNK